MNIKNFLFLLLPVWVCGSLSAQCPFGNVTFTNQQAVDEFAVLYPNCTEINGDLDIFSTYPSTPVTDLSPLAKITSIAGNLEITNNHLTDLSYLDNVTFIGQNVRIINNDSLLNLSGLEGITSINRRFNIEGNDNLVSLTGLENLTSIGQYLVIKNNGSLINFTGLNNLTTIGEYFIVTNNDALTNFTGMDNLTTIESYLFVTENDVLTDFTGTNNLVTSPSSDIYIAGNEGLMNLNGFLTNMTSVNILEIIDNNSLINLNGLESLTSVEFNLYINDNYGLNTLSGLENLTSVGYNFYVVNNPDLTSLNGLDNLDSIGSKLLIEGNMELSNLMGLESIIHANDLSVIDNDNLISLRGIENIDDNSLNFVTIRLNDSLKTCNIYNICSYLENGGVANINSNAPNCNTPTEILDACDVLPVEVLDKLQVYLKNETAILEWRTATETNNAGFEIQRSKDGIAWEKIGWQEGRGNTITPHAYTYGDKNPFFGTSYYRFKQVDFTGDFKYSNAVSLQYTRPAVAISPNPNTGIFNVRGIPKGIYQILNTSGQIIRQGELKNNITIDISDAAQGVYFISVTIDNEYFVKRLVKM